MSNLYEFKVKLICMLVYKLTSNSLTFVTQQLSHLSQQLLQFSPTSPLVQQLELRESMLATLMMEPLTPFIFHKDSQLEI